MEFHEHAGPLRVRVAVPQHPPLDVAAARLALFNSALAQRTHGALIVRIDTFDGDVRSSTRCSEELAWLGIRIDEGPYLRCDRREAYAEHLQRLVAGGSAYEREDALWFRVAPGSTVVRDAVKGDVTFDHANVDDFRLREPDGTPAASFASAVDDATMRIDLVLRGDALLSDAPREIMLAKALGFAAPRFAHAGTLLADTEDDELPSIAELRREGYLPDAVVEHLALLGWSAPDGRETFTLDEFARVFSLDRVGGSPSHFDRPRLRAFNARALRALPREEYHALLAAWMQRARLLEDPIPEAAGRWIETFLDAYGSEVHTLRDALEEVAKLREEAVTIPALELERLRNRQVLFFLDAVNQYIDDQPELRNLPLAADLPEIAKEFGIARDDAFAAVRMALTGSHDGPPLGLLFPLLGHDRMMIRIGAVNSHILHGRGLEPIRFGPGGVPFETMHGTAPDAQATASDERGS